MFSSNSHVVTPHVLSVHGRINRVSFIAWHSLNLIVQCVFWLFSPWYADFNALTDSLDLIVILATLYIFVLTNIRRLHDFNQSGWLALLSLIPIINIFFGLFLCCLRGDEHSNRYGPARSSQLWEKILSLSVILMGISMLLFLITALFWLEQMLPAFEQLPQAIQGPYI